LPAEGPPPPHRWAERDPDAATRLARSRELVATVAATHRLPPENLITPDSVRRLAWSPPDPLDEDAVREVLAGFGARPWQVALTAPGLTEALRIPADAPGVPADPPGIPVDLPGVPADPPA
jgi:ribonuclease D